MDTHSRADAALVRAVGVWGLAAAIFNVTVGGGIFRLPAAVHELIGPAAPLVYVVCALVMGLIVLTFAEAGSRVALTGGPYAYVEVVFGPFAGFMSGVLVWLLGTLAVASVATAFAEQVSTLVPALAGAASRAILLVAVFALISWINVRGVRQATSFIKAVSVAKLLPLLVLVGVGLFFVERANLTWTPAEAPTGGGIARAAIVLIFAFTGVESALVPSGEVSNPSRTVPRALAIAMVGITLLYIVVQVVAQGVLGAGLADVKAAPLAAVAERIMGPGGRLLLLVGAIVSMFGYLSGMTLAVPRALFALARDGFLPRQVMAVHERYRTPHVSIVLQTVIVLALAITSSFEQLAVLANLAALLLYAMCAVAAWELRRRDVRLPDGSKPVVLPGGPTVHILAVAVIGWLLTSITPAEWIATAIALGVAAVLFLFRRKNAPEAIA